MNNRIREWREARGWSQGHLGALIGCSQPQVSRWERGTRKLTEERLRQFSAALGVGIAELLDPSAECEGDALDGLPTTLIGEPDLPVYGATERGRNGALYLSDGPIQLVRRPEPLLRVAGGFGLYVAGESMEPAYRQGDIVLLHPSMPPRRGDDVVLIQIDRRSDRQALIKQLIDWSADDWTVSQHNPPETFTLDRKQWPKAHVVVARYNRR